MPEHKQETNKQHPVPQNIMDVEFKLIGQLTMRQFFYLLFFGLLGYLLQLFLIGLFRWPLALVSWLFGLGFAFLPVEERGMDEWIVNFIKSVYSPTQRYWKKTPDIPFALSYSGVDVVKQELITLAPTASRRRLEEYLDYKEGEEEKIDPLDIPEDEYIMKIKKAYVDYAPAPASVPAPGPAQTQVKGEEQEPLDIVQKPKEKVEPTHKEKKEVKTQEKLEIVKSNVTKPKGYRPERTSLKPITPDMHAGRRFTNLLPAQGELVLPIRGERVLEVSGPVDSKEDVKAKTDKLQRLLTEIRKSENMPKSKIVQPEAATPPVSVEEDVKQESYVTGAFSKQKLVNRPNIVSGIVLNDSGKPMSGVLLIIKDEKDEPIRAFKTNTLGQFLINTPLRNGNYTLNVSKTNDANISFDIISIEAKGGIIPPFEVKGKINEK